MAMMSRLGTVVLLLLAVVACLATVASATEYIVGDDYGWRKDFDYKVWAADKAFYVGDVLVFNYMEGYHTVIKVNGTGYVQCQKTPNAGILASGNDRVTLATPGNKWYICGVGDHCSDHAQKLKITVYAKDIAPALPPLLPQAPAPAPAAEAPWY